MDENECYYTMESSLHTDSSVNRNIVRPVEK